MTQDNQHNEMPKDTIEALLRDPLGLSTVAADSGKGHDYMCGASDQFQKDEKITKALIRTAHNKGVEVGEGNKNAVVKEYKDEGAMFILKIEDGKTYEASMPIPKWAEVGKLEYRTPLPEEVSL